MNRDSQTINGSSNGLDAGAAYTDGRYLEKNASWHVEDSAWKADHILKVLSKYNIAPKTACEVGCGAGEIIKQLSLKMPMTEFQGYELSPQAYEMCRTRETDRVRYHNASIFNDNQTFDILLCIDVFEHVEDYIGFVRALKTKASYAIFHIPLDINVLSILRGGMMTARNTTGHLHYFTPDTAIATLTDSGYRIIDSRLTAYFDELPSTTLKSKIAKLPRKLLYSISPALMVRLMGGCSLMVLAST